MLNPILHSPQGFPDLNTASFLTYKGGVQPNPSGGWDVNVALTVPAHNPAGSPATVVLIHKVIHVATEALANEALRIWPQQAFTSFLQILHAEARELFGATDGTGGQLADHLRCDGVPAELAEAFFA